MLFISGCTKERYIWKINANSHFGKYQNFWFKGDDFKAKYYLEYAINEAKNSYQVTDLATLHLSSCAIQKARFEAVTCSQYELLVLLAPNKELQAYHAFINGKPLDIEYLTKRYINVYEAIKQKNSTQVYEAIKKLKSPISKAIASYVAHLHGLYDEVISDYMIDTASMYGYHALMLQHMHQKVALLEQRDAFDEAQKIKSFIEVIQK